MRLVTLFVLTAFTLGGLALAHEEHCHKKGKKGELIDLKRAKTEKDCRAEGGEWTHHHAHCHKKSAGGTLQDVEGVADEQTCVAKDGKWVDHGHKSHQTLAE